VAKKKNIFSHPRRSGPDRRWGWLIILILLLIAGFFFLLENLKERYLHSAKTDQTQGEKSSMPPKAAVEYQHDIYTASRVVPVPPPEAKIQVQVAAPKGSIAIVIDDMGSSLQEARSLMSINLPLTFAIIPGLANAKGVAEAAHAKGVEVMLHIPMEPQGYPQQRLEKNGLLMSYDTDEINSRMRGYLQAVPYAVGANNHMGSRFTEHEEKMLPVISMLKEKGLFFIDSRTTPKSVGYQLARKMAVAAGSREVFLDNLQDIDAIKEQLAEAARMARKRKGVIAICHPHPATISALAEGMPELQRSGITFVTASRLVR
jgi:polysaccharide deacetylase 2 family uncharacterized protein YibQ